MSAIENLQHLVRRGFRAAPVHDDGGELEALLYTRHWRCGVVDVLVVRSHEDAFAYRAAELDPRTPLAPRSGAMRWHCEGHPDHVTEAVLGLLPADRSEAH